MNTAVPTSSSERSVLVVGATSMLGREIAQQYAADGWRVLLAARDTEELRYVASDIAIRSGGKVENLHLDLADTTSIDQVAAKLRSEIVPQAIVFVAAISDASPAVPEDPALARSMIEVNYAGPTRLIGALLPTLRKAPETMIVLVSSVAGERGRRGNYVYGASKAALNTYAQGLRAALAPDGAGVLTVKLGYMDTRLAYGLTPPLLTCSPRYAARIIRRCADRRRMVIYVPFFWRWICLVLRAIPERLFIRLPIP